jgi:cell division protein FtsQ
MGARLATRGLHSGVTVSLILVALALLGVLWVYQGMVNRDQWPVRWLEVDGAFERVSAEQLRSGLMPLIAGSFFVVDSDAVRAAALRQPWVSGVLVQKHWPDTVKVQVTEYVPVAHWTNGRLVAAGGLAFRVPGADEIQGLPWLEGADSDLPRVFGAWRDFNNELLPAGLEIDRIRLDRRGAWFLALTGGTEIHVGRADPVPRLRRLVAGWDRLMDGRGVAPLSVDLRYTNGFAVRWPAAPVKLAGNYGKEN